MVDYTMIFSNFKYEIIIVQYPEPIPSITQPKWTFYIKSIMRRFT